MAEVGIAGTTSWGTTLAIILARRGVAVRLWARTEEEAAQLRAEGQNSRFVPGESFPKGLSVAASPREAFRAADLVIIAVPSRTLRDNIRKIRDSLDDAAIIVSATKGLEVGTGKRMSQLLEEELPPALRSKVCALSGPNLAREIVQGKPSSTVVASSNPDAAVEAQAIINSPRFRVYTNDDIVGVELGGALKNIIALGAGICDGLGLGDNAKAAFMTRGLAEITRLAVAAGANPLTLAGLAGMGDLIATCASPLSRNHYVGEQLARGKGLQDIRASMQNVAEGVDTTAAAVALAEKLGVEMPIAQATYDVLFNGVPLERAIAELLGRAPRPERAGLDV
jgi:glycerol-3-phosphate dehydrogenase (NAD(P)+)